LSKVYEELKNLEREDGCAKSPSLNERSQIVRENQEFPVESSFLAARENVRAGFGKAFATAARVLVVVLCLSAAFFFGRYSRRVENSRTIRPLAAEPKASAMPPSAPAPSFAPKPSSDVPVFVLQVAAMAHEGNANALVESLRREKYVAFVSKSENGRFYRVLVGPYADGDSATKIKEELERKGFQVIRGAWKPVAEPLEPAARSAK